MKQRPPLHNLNNHENGKKLTSGGLLAKNVLWNLLGQVTPMFVALFCIPLIIRGLGTDRFGVLTLVWIVIGYFCLFDFGLGRTLTKMVAEKLGKDESGDIPSLVWTGLAFMAALGLIGGLLLATFSASLVHKILKIPVSLQAEALKAFYVMSLTIPVVVTSAGFRGILEAYQLFGIVNRIRLPLGLFNYISPLLLLPFSTSLFPIVSVLAFGRFLAWIAYLCFCLRKVPGLRLNKFQLSNVRQLLSFGGWLTISNIVGPLMVYFDRFLIGVYVSVAAVAYYSTPCEIVTKLWVIPVSVVGVLFPAFSTSVCADRNRAIALYERGFSYIFLVVFPICTFIEAFAYEGLQLWLGTEFALNSTLVLKLVTVGVFVNSFARLSVILIQGAGRPDLIATLTIFESVLYLPLLWWLLSIYGIVGAAVCWTARIVLDTLILYGISCRLISQSASVIRRKLSLLSMALISFAVVGIPSALGIRIILFCLIYSSFCCLAWFLLLGQHEREIIKRRLSSSVRKVL